MVVIPEGEMPITRTDRSPRLNPWPRPLRH